MPITHGRQIKPNSVLADRLKATNSPSSGQYPVYDPTTKGITWTTPGGGGGNALLDGSAHTDTTAGTVARGDLVVGQDASPTWKRLAKGTNRQVLTCDGTDAAWKVAAPMEVWGLCSPTAASLAASTSWAPVPLIQYSGFINFSFDLGSCLHLPGGWLTGFSSLAHRFTVEAWRSSGTGTGSFRLRDVTNGNTLASVTSISAGSRTFYSSTSFSNIPSGDAIIEWQYQTSDGSTTIDVHAGSWFAQAA